MGFVPTSLNVRGDRSFARERGIAEFGTSRTEGKGGSCRKRTDQVSLTALIAAEPPDRIENSMCCGL